MGQEQVLEAAVARVGEWVDRGPEGVSRVERDRIGADQGRVAVQQLGERAAAAERRQPARRPSS
jgi:hypothetical protein